jgi:1-acyl-sn-glycerol-3-phosphate acyltransferase
VGQWEVFMSEYVWSRFFRKPERVDGPDYSFGVKALRFLDLLARYFRVEIHGLDRIPPGPAILVGNHNAGITFFDPMFLGAAWYRRTGGTDDFIYLVHDAMLVVPGLGTFLRKMGAARASRAVADEALAAGRKIMVYPGGNHEAFRPFTQRHRIDLGGHLGFCSLAIRHQVPIVPVVGVGSHETFVVLARGAGLARALRLDRLLRIQSFPLVLGLPWGLSVGPLFHLPLPAKITLTIGAPIPVAEHPPGSADDPAVLRQLHDRVAAAMQAIMDAAASERRWPILG